MKLQSVQGAALVSVLLAGALLTAGCAGASAHRAGGSGPESAEAAAAGEASEKAVSESEGEAKPAALAGVPAACARESSGGYCLPDERFVRKLCDDVHADVALWMFRQGTPWTRAYLTRKTEAWNASGGASVQGELQFDEEVLILRERSLDSGGIQVSGAMGSYDALRWNGSCVSLMAEEITKRSPPRLLHSRVEWRWLSDAMQEALRQNPEIVEIYRARRKECKGVSIGEVSQKCEQLDKKLVDVIVQHVRAGGQLVEPKFP